MAELLSPYRVLDLTDEKGVWAGKLLSDMGADVIKVEPPGGDPARMEGPFYQDVPEPEKSLSWFEVNGNKRGITLNLKSADGREVFRELVKKSDIILESFEPGFMPNLGLGYDSLISTNPRLIMTSITPFGQHGPKANYRTSELIRWASTGVMYCTGDPDRPPNWIAIPQSRIHGGLEGAFATLVALHYRNRTGLGQYIDVSIQAACIDSLMDTLEMWLFAGIDYGRHSYSNVTSNKGVAQKFALRCKDGHVTFYTLGGGLLASAEHLGRVRNWMSQECSLPEWFTKIDFVREYDSAAIDQELVDKVEGTIEGFLLTKTKEEIFSKSLSDGLISAPVQDSTEVWKNEQLKARNFWRSIEHKELNARIPYAGPFAILSETPVQIKRPAPLIGEHNEEVYLSELGMTKERYILLREIGAM